jgi:hypothetical protein
MVKKNNQKGGSYTSDKVNSSSPKAGQEALDDIFNLTIMPTPLMSGGAKKTKNRKRKSIRKTKKKKTKRRKMTRGSKKSKMCGGGVANLMGCGPVNNASTFQNPGCNRETIMNPPNLGLAGSGINSVDGHAGL